MDSRHTGLLTHSPEDGSRDTTIHEALTLVRCPLLQPLLSSELPPLCPTSAKALSIHPGTLANQETGLTDLPPDWRGGNAV